MTLLELSLLICRWETQKLQDLSELNDQRGGTWDRRELSGPWVQIPAPLGLVPLSSSDCQMGLIFACKPWVTLNQKTDAQQRHRRRLEGVHPFPRFTQIQAGTGTVASATQQTVQMEA